MNIEEYQGFVEKLTSNASKDANTLVCRIMELNCDLNIASLMTGSTGLACEASELQEIVKKILYQGKPLTSDLKIHMRKELGDVLFYFMVACEGLDTTLEEVMQMNVIKLSNRYKSGRFSAEQSETRKAGDV
jgi:NTP pyrophosphatase (non-canonical NTP hydrolase)